MLNNLRWRFKSFLKLVEYCFQLLEYLLFHGWNRERVAVRFSSINEASFDFAKPLCLFSSFDARGVVRPCVYYYLEQLRAAGFDIIFVSTSASISDDDRNRLAGICGGVISRSNRGYDFYSWKTAMRLYPDYVRHAGVLLANDSVFGPLFPLKDTVARLMSGPADVIGMTDSLRYRPHLQSYFVFLKRNVIVSEPFARFFSKVNTIDYKGYIIRKYEVGLSKCLARRFRLTSLFDTRTVFGAMENNARPLDRTSLTVHAWDTMLCAYRFPFLKRSLVASGKVSVEDVAAVLKKAGSAYDVSLIAYQKE